jgi:hypothetical protein
MTPERRNQLRERAAVEYLPAQVRKTKRNPAKYMGTDKSAYNLLFAALLTNLQQGRNARPNLKLRLETNQSASWRSTMIANILFSLLLSGGSLNIFISIASRSRSLVCEIELPERECQRDDTIAGLVTVQAQEPWTGDQPHPAQGAST